MVSFQCHACGDVVKKPKLDQHRGRCHSGFDCIDCSTTFNTPNEYKGHTQCISEAEKYQKSLYKGPKTGPPRNNYPQQPSTYSEPSSTGKYQSWGRNGGNRPGWGQARTTATGANDTPLGTPKYASPVTLSPAPTPAPAATSNPSTNGVSNGIKNAEAVEKDKKKNDKKQKSKATGQQAATSIPVVSDPPVNNASQHVEPTGEAAVTEKKKKDKKRKSLVNGESNTEPIESQTSKAKHSDASISVEAPVLEGEMAGKSNEEEKRKKDKKDKRERKEKKEKKNESSSDTKGADVNSEDKETKSKSKKRKRDSTMNGVEVSTTEEKKKGMDVEPTAVDGEILKKKKKSKKLKESSNEVTARA